MAVAYQFRPMTASDLPRVRGWLAQPHVKEWWGDTDEQFELVSGDLSLETMDQFIVLADDRPFAYIQSYEPDNWPGHGLGDHPHGTIGIDQFIGEADMVNRGHGSTFIRVFVEKLIANGAPRVITDPDPVNARAIRAYQKAGFRVAHEVDTSEGRALLMVCDK